MSFGLAVSAPAAGPLVALARLEAGQWQIKTLGSDAAPRALCLADAGALVQYGHSGTQCQHVIVTNETDLATVQYTCSGIGHGVTSFKVATPRNFNLETQGILNGAPFDEHYEARRIGTCSTR